MQIEINDSCQEPKVIILANKMTDEVNAVLKRLSEEAPQIIAGFRKNTVEILEQSDIIRFYAGQARCLQ